MRADPFAGYVDLGNRNINIDLVLPEGDVPEDISVPADANHFPVSPDIRCIPLGVPEARDDRKEAGWERVAANTGVGADRVADLLLIAFAVSPTESHGIKVTLPFVVGTRRCGWTGKTSRRLPAKCFKEEPTLLIERKRLATALVQVTASIFVQIAENWRQGATTVHGS